MIRRLGAAKGTGSGYRNLRNFPKDPLVHSQSSKGIKQPQKIHVLFPLNRDWGKPTDNSAYGHERPRWLKDAIKKADNDQIKKLYGGKTQSFKPTPIKFKKYACAKCGHEMMIDTNHYGECYSLGHYNTCPNCPPYAKYPEFGGSTTWICKEKAPSPENIPPKWKKVKLGDVAEIVKGGKKSSSRHITYKEDEYMGLIDALEKSKKGQSYKGISKKADKEDDYMGYIDSFEKSKKGLPVKRSKGGKIPRLLSPANPNRKIYRAQYVRNDGKTVWVTTVWRRDKDEAESDISCFASPNRVKEMGFDTVKIVEEDYDDFLRKKQRLPRF